MRIVCTGMAGDLRCAMHVESLSVRLSDAGDSFLFSDTSSLCLSFRNMSRVSSPQNIAKSEAGKQVNLSTGKQVNLSTGKQVNLSTGSHADQRREAVPVQSLTSTERDILYLAQSYGPSLSFWTQLSHSYRHAQAWRHPKRWKVHLRTHLTYKSALPR